MQSLAAITTAHASFLSFFLWWRIMDRETAENLKSFFCLLKLERDNRAANAQFHEDTEAKRLEYCSTNDIDAEKDLEEKVEKYRKKKTTARRQRKKPRP